MVRPIGVLMKSPDGRLLSGHPGAKAVYIRFQHGESGRFYSGQARVFQAG